MLQTETKLAERKEPIGRLHSLDSLRGLAAVLVVLTHALSAFPDRVRHGRINLDTIIYPGGRFAVMLFFILSGFVLTIPYLSGKERGYPAFAIRRFFRIYPAFAFSVILAATLDTLIAGHVLPVASAWLNSFWTTRPTTRDILAHLMMTGVHVSSTRLDSPIWSLIIEMRISLLFPLLVLYVRRFGRTGVAVALLAILPIVKLATLSGATPFVANNLIGVLLLTCRYIPLFMLGVLVALYFTHIRTFMCRRHGGFLTAIALAGFAGCLAVGHFGLEVRGFADLYFGLFAAYLVAICAGVPRCSAFLCASFLQFLGKISYSLYLVHVPILLTACYLAGPRLPLAAALALALPVMLIVSALMYKFIERPSIAVGRIYSQRVTREADASRAAAVA